MSILSNSLIELQSLQSSQSQANSIIKTWDLYADVVADSLEKVDGVTIHHDYYSHNKEENPSIPPPATFIIDLGLKLTENEEGETISLYSDYPFPWRERQKNDFAEKSLTHFRENPGIKQAYNIEKNNNKWYWKYAQAVIMKRSCIGCHNDKASESPKKNWNVGDVRGVVAISKPLEEITGQTKEKTTKAFLVLGGLSIVGLCGIAAVKDRLNQTKQKLERQVKERTADLTEVKQKLEERNTLVRKISGINWSDEDFSDLLDSLQSLRSSRAERRKVSILVADLRGFTTISEKLSAEDTIAVLNIYMEHAIDIINQYQGSLFEIMGDRISILFGIPKVRDDDSLRAIACAAKMQLEMGTVNQKLKERNFPQLKLGIGINTGSVVLGNTGLEKQSRYNIAGSQVDLAYYIESYAKGGQVLISKSTLQKWESIVSIRGTQQVQPLGIKEPISLYELNGIEGKYNLFLPREGEILDI